MKEISASQIEQVVRDLCIKANIILPASLEARIKEAGVDEESPVGKEVLCDLCRNIEAARCENVAICRDTGMAVIYLNVGQEVHVTGGALEEAVNRGVARGYTEGYLRCSVVKDPLERVNTNNNTPAVIHTRIVPGDSLEIHVCPKGFGSENMSALKMFTPSATMDELCGFIVDTVAKAGSNPCPPIVVGVGIGGNFEYSAFLAKKALCRDVSIRNEKPLYRDMEARLLNEINALGIGPQGFGGRTTALAVNIEEYPTHIAGLPVAVNVGCHVTRHATAVL